MNRNWKSEALISGLRRSNRSFYVWQWKPAILFCMMLPVLLVSQILMQLEAYCRQKRLLIKWITITIYLRINSFKRPRYLSSMLNPFLGLRFLSTSEASSIEVTSLIILIIIRLDVILLKKFSKMLSKLFSFFLTASYSLSLKYMTRQLFPADICF